MGAREGAKWVQEAKDPSTPSSTLLKNRHWLKKNDFLEKNADLKQFFSLKKSVLPNFGHFLTNIYRFF